MTTELSTAAPTQLMHDQTQLYLINDFTAVWTRTPICPHFLSYTVTNYSYWLNRVCQNSLCPDLCEKNSTILSGFEVAQLFFLYFSICIYSYSVPISTEEAESSHEGESFCFTSSTSSRHFLHSFLSSQKGHSIPPENHQQTSKKQQNLPLDVLVSEQQKHATKRILQSTRLPIKAEGLVCSKIKLPNPIENIKGAKEMTLLPISWKKLFNQSLAGVQGGCSARVNQQLSNADLCQLNSFWRSLGSGVKERKLPLTGVWDERHDKGQSPWGFLGFISVSFLMKHLFPR